MADTETHTMLPAIGFWGGMALLISSITGPGLTTIPLLFQEAGWFSPTMAFIVFAVIAASVSLLLGETMSTIHGNEAFQSKVEYSTIAHLYLGDRWHWFMQVLLYFALQSVNISSIIISEQTMDSLIIRLFHKTCALSFTDGWTCVREVNPAGSPFDSYILFSYGYLVSACMVIPLSMMSLVQNIKFQLASVASLFFVMTCWIFIFAHHGLDQDIPAFGNNQSSLIGFVLNNFAFITTVPSFINELSRSVSIHKIIIYAVLVCVSLYLIIGLLGAASFQISESSDILATLSAASQNKVLIIIVNILFPISVLVTSVPVFAIVIRYNLVRGGVCSERWATILASVLPWLLIIPFQTKGYLVLIMNWASLIFGSTTNFIMPLLLFLASKRYSASATDTRGGDILVLRRENSTASMRSHSQRRSTHSQSQTLQIPQIITTSPPRTSVDQQDVATTSAVSTSSQFPHSPSRSRGSSFTEKNPTRASDNEIDLAKSNDHASGSNSSLDPSIPLRVIYSPSVSRQPSIGHRSSISSHSVQRSRGPHGDIVDADDTARPARNTDTDSGDLSIEIPSALHRRSSSPQRESIHSPVLSPPGGAFSRFSRLLKLPHSNQRTRIAPDDDHRDRPIPIFRAFPERKWINSEVIAQAALSIVLCAVLGNLIYTIISTARGNSPLN